MWGALEYASRALLPPTKPFVIEPCVSMAVLFLFEVHDIYRDELKLHDVNHVPPVLTLIYITSSARGLCAIVR